VTCSLEQFNIVLKIFTLSSIFPRKPLTRCNFSTIISMLVNIIYITISFSKVLFKTFEACFNLKSLKRDGAIVMEHYYFEELVEEQDKLNVFVEVGSVSVYPHDGRIVIVEAEAQHMNLTMNRNENTLFVQAKCDEAWRNTSRKLSWPFSDHNPRAHLTIHAPIDCQLQVKVITGKLSIRGVAAPVTTRVVTGQTRLEDLGGPIWAKTVTGNIYYQGALANDNHRFEATTGRISLSLSQVPDAQLDARTTTGRIHCGLPLSDKTDQTHRGPGSRLTGNLGSGEGRIAARIVTGSLHLENLQHPVPSV
jgi:DUF4097 and DUF4098 domain-containing protein YvlB